MTYRSNIEELTTPKKQTTKPPKTKPCLLDNNDSAGLLGCSPHTLKISRHTGKLFGVAAPAYMKMGYNIRYKVETLQAWMDQFQEQSSTSENIGGAA